MRSSPRRHGTKVRGVLRFAIYRTTTFTVVRKKAASGFKPVTIDCLGALTGWKPIGATGDYEFTNVDLVRDNQPK